MIEAKAKANTGQMSLVGISYLSFIVLGIPGAALGVAWTYIRETFGLPLDAVGILLAASTIGYFIASANAGRLVARMGIGQLLVISCGVAAIGAAGYVASPSWPVMVLFGLLLGLGGGAVDSVMNIFFAARFGPRLMNWLHAFFGVGATLGPLMMTAILSNGGSWRLGYAIVVGLYVLLAVLFGMTRDRWYIETHTDEAVKAARPSSTIRLPVVWLGISLFVLFAAQEIIPGQWTFSLFTETRGISEEAAGLWVSIYWASFTVGRFVFGFVINWLGPKRLMRLCLYSSIVGAALLWWSPSDLVGFIGLIIFGFSLAPLFPVSISNAQERLGPQHAPNAIGFYVGAASLGIGILPGLAGVFANSMGLTVIPLMVLILAVVMTVLYEVDEQLAVKRKNG